MTTSRTTTPQPSSPHQCVEDGEERGQPCKAPSTAVEMVRQLLAERRHRGFRALESAAQQRHRPSSAQASPPSPPQTPICERLETQQGVYDAAQTLRAMNEMMWHDAGRRGTNATMTTNTTTNTTNTPRASTSSHSRRTSHRPPCHSSSAAASKGRPSLVYTAPEPEYYAGFLGDVLQPRQARRTSRASRPPSSRPRLHSQSTSVASRERAYELYHGDGTHRDSAVSSSMATSTMRDEAVHKARRQRSSVLDPLAQHAARPEAAYDAQLASAMVSTLADMRHADQYSVTSSQLCNNNNNNNNNNSSSSSLLLSAMQRRSSLLEAYNFPTAGSVEGGAEANELHTAMMTTMGSVSPSDSLHYSHSHTRGGQQQQQSVKSTSASRRRTSDFTTATSTGTSSTYKRPVMPLPRPCSSSLASSSHLYSSTGRTTRLQSTASKEPQLSSDQLTEAFYVRPRGAEMARSAYLHFVQQEAVAARSSGSHHKPHTQRPRMVFSAPPGHTNAMNARSGSGNKKNNNNTMDGDGGEGRAMLLPAVLSETQHRAAMPAEMTYHASDLTQRVIRALLEQRNPLLDDQTKA